MKWYVENNNSSSGDQGGHAGGTQADPRLKKRIIRTLVEEIVVEIDINQSEVELVIRWMGDTHSELRGHRHRRGQSGAHTSSDVVEAKRHLALICRDKEIAAYVNRNRISTARGNTWRPPLPRGQERLPPWQNRT